MWSYITPIRDMQFVIDELLCVQRDWAQIPTFCGLDSDTVPQVLEEAGRFVAQTLGPLNGPGDLQGCRYEAGSVKTPDGFADAYRRYCHAGWPTLACDPDHGGQGLPQILNAALYEMLFAANHAWTMYPGLAHGAYECLRAHAADHIKSLYLPNVVSGKWLCTMCLTEPQAGSDLGLVRTRAELQTDGSYAITGSKIFISGGEHDLTDNILHLVLARLPDAPKGTKGISLFLVPKHLPEGQDLLPNTLRCDGIETKMGIKGSATCVMTFNAAKGWLIGEAHRGLAAMFVMMNSARLYVGLQGLGHAEMAYQNARRYSHERLQMRAVNRPIGTAIHPSGADPIAFQPAIRRTLLTMRAFVEGERALGYWCAHLLDIAEHHPDFKRRADANDQVSVLTPIVKSFFTENGFSLTSAGLQVWGGYGYIHDNGIEQSVRDSRIAMIYEGTNEIQAIDLLIRKVIVDDGKKIAALVCTIHDEANLCAASPGCELFGDTLRTLYDDIVMTTRALITESSECPEHAYRIAPDYLRLIGLSLIGRFWASAARVSVPRAADTFYRAKLETANFFFNYLLPETRYRLDLIDRRSKLLPLVEVE